MTKQDLSLAFPGSSMFALSITSRTRRPSTTTSKWRLFNPEVRKRSPFQGHKPLEGWTYKNRVPWQMKRLKNKPCTNEKEEFSIYNYNFFNDFCCTIFNILLIGNKYAKVKLVLSPYKKFWPIWIRTPKHMSCSFSSSFTNPISMA